MRCRRWTILILLLLLYTQVLAWLCFAAAVIIVEPLNGWGECAKGVLDFFTGDFDGLVSTYQEEYFWFYFLGPALLVAGTQIVFLIPVVRPPVRGGAGKPLLRSFIAAGIVGAGLATGLFLAVVQLVHLIAGLDVEIGLDGYWSYVGWILLPLGLSWLAWTAAIALFARPRPKPNVFSQLLGLLLGATLIEVLIVLPLDIMVRRRTNCYCNTGTAHTLGLAAWAGLWLAGPGIVLALTSKRRRWWFENHCAGCGYEKGPSPGERCPECGHAWKSQTAEQPDSRKRANRPDLT